MIRIRAGGGAGGEGTTDLVALSRSTLESHLRLLLASQQRVEALEQEVAAAGREASVGAGANQASLPLHVSEGGAGAIVDNVAGAFAQRRFPHGATLTGIPTVAELPAVAPAGGGDFVQCGRGSAGRAAVGKGGLGTMRGAESKQEGWGSGASGMAGEVQGPSILRGK
ncbi:unnamed protein product, partial [Ectocarpus fasciculatus]